MVQSSLMPKTKTTTPKKSAADQKAANQPSLVSDNTKLTITISSDQAEQAYQKTLKKEAKKVKSKGFRQGKVPPKVAEEKIGQPALIEQAINSLLPEAYTELMKKEQKQPLGQPQFSIIEAQRGQDWKIEVQIAEKPTFSIKDYQKLAKKGLKTAEAELKKQAEANKKETQNSKKETTPGQAKDQAQQDQNIKLQAIFRELVTTYQPQIPELLVKQETERQLRDISHQLKHMKSSLEAYLERQQRSFEDFTSELAAQSLGQLQLEFILDAIAQEAKLQVTNKDLDSEIKRIFPDDGTAIKNPYLRQQMAASLQRQKITDHLLSL